MAHTPTVDLSWRALFLSFGGVAAVSLLCGALIGWMVYPATCTAAPDRPQPYYSRTVLVCEMPAWWR